MITGADIRPGHILLSGHFAEGQPFYVDSVEPHPNMGSWSLVTGRFAGEVCEMPYQLTEEVTVQETSDPVVFRAVVRRLVHAGPNDTDADVLAMLDKDHNHRADSIGCIGCD